MRAFQRNMAVLLRDERGTTIAEVAVTTSVMVAAMAIVFSFLVSSQDTYNAQADRTVANDQASLVLLQVERDVRSGNVVGPPTAHASLTGAQVGVYTQVNGRPACVQYQVANGELRRRERTPGPGVAWPGTWSTVADEIENASLSPAVPPFARSGDGRTLLVKLVLRSGRGAERVTVQTSITGRNSSSFHTPFAGGQCT